MSANIAVLKSELKDLETDLKTAHPDDVDVLKSAIKSVKAQISEEENEAKFQIVDRKTSSK